MVKFENKNNKIENQYQIKLNDLNLEDLLKMLVEKLTENGKKVSTMESCTGGGLANAITNVSGSSEVFNFGAVTYSNDFKVKMGVNAEIIDKFTVYSEQTANEMSKSIVQFSGADYGVGITGQLKRVDPHNKCGKDDLVYISVYDKCKNAFCNRQIHVFAEKRVENKEFVIRNAVEMLLGVLCVECKD